MPLTYGTALLAQLNRAVEDARDMAFTSFQGMARRFPAVAAKDAGGVRHVITTNIGTAGAYVEGAGYNAPSTPTHTGGLRDFGNYDTSMVITHKSEIRTRFVARSGQMNVDVDQLAEDLRLKIMSMYQLFSTDMVNGNAANRIDGLATRAIQTAAGFAVYQGINRAVFPTHAVAEYTAGAPRNISVDILEAAKNDFEMVVLAEFGGAGAVSGATGWEIWCGQAQFDRIKALNVGVHANEAPAGVKILGWESVRFGNIPVYAVPGWTANRVDFVAPAAIRRESLELGSQAAQNPSFSSSELRGEFELRIPQSAPGTDILTYTLVAHQQVKLTAPRFNSFFISNLA